jgi:hypothetical protein
MIIAFFAFLTVVNFLLNMFPDQGQVMVWNQIGILFSFWVYTVIQKRYHLPIREMLSNLAVLFLFVLNVYVVLGSLAHAMLSLRYPGLLSRNYVGAHAYMTQCLMVFALTTMIIFKPIRQVKKAYLTTESNKLYGLFMAMGLSATALGILRLGFVPILSVTYSDERFFEEFGLLFTRFWGYLVYPFAYFVYSFFKSDELHKTYRIVLAVACFLPMFMLNIRYTATLATVIVILIAIEIMPKKINPKYALFLLIALLLAVEVPSFIAGKRSVESERTPYTVTGSAHSDRFLNLLIIDSFSGNYVQTIDLVTRYSDFRYGETLLNSALVILPSQLLYAVGIEKKEIRQDNAAFFLAQMTSGTRSGGLRTGIMGEFYVNFGMLGSVFMILWALLLNWVSSVHKRLHDQDFRRVLYYPIAASLIYGVLGQPDVIASMFYNTFLVGFVLFLFSKPSPRRQEFTSIVSQ